MGTHADAAADNEDEDGDDEDDEDVSPPTPRCRIRNRDVIPVVLLPFYLCRMLNRGTVSLRLYNGIIALASLREATNGNRGALNEASEGQYYELDDKKRRVRKPDARRIRRYQWDSGIYEIS